MAPPPRIFTNLDPSLRRCWHPVALVDAVPDDAPLGVRLLGERWLVARLDGELVAMRDRCPHRLVPLSAGRIVGNEIECAYHGYRFGANGGATCIPALPADVPIPPKACVDTALVTTKFGLVWLCLDDDPLDDLLDDAGYTDPANDLFVAGPFTTKVSAGTLTDNFLDSAHFPFLHAATFGGDDDGRPSIRVEREGWRIHQYDTQIVGGAHIDEPVDSVAVYEVGLPFSVELRIDRPDGSDFIWSFVTPADADTSVWFMVHAYPLDGDAGEIAAARDLQIKVGEEDLWILEQMDDPHVPLDLRVEVHTKADLGCLEYRRMLAELAASARDDAS